MFESYLGAPTSILLDSRGGYWPAESPKQWSWPCWSVPPPELAIAAASASPLVGPQPPKYLVCAGAKASAMHPPGPLASRRQSLIVARHAFIADCSAAVWLPDPVLAIEICPVESDITIAIQLLSACATGVAANATPIVIVRVASFFMGIPTLLRGTTARDRTSDLTGSADGCGLV
jgi:hypothetical protein